jgi:hypothetical protein
VPLPSLSGLGLAGDGILSQSTPANSSANLWVFRLQEHESVSILRMKRRHGAGTIGLEFLTNSDF